MSDSLLLIFACTNCGRMASADPEWVMTIDVHRGADGQPVVVPGEKNPLCEACARLKIEAHHDRGWTVPELYESADYWARAYPAAAAEG